MRHYLRLSNVFLSIRNQNASANRQVNDAGFAAVLAYRSNLCRVLSSNLQVHSRQYHRLPQMLADLLPGVLCIAKDMCVHEWVQVNGADQQLLYTG